MGSFPSGLPIDVLGFELGIQQRCGGLRVDRPTAADQIGRPNCRNGDLGLTKMAIEILDLAMTEVYVDGGLIGSSKIMRAE